MKLELGSGSHPTPGFVRLDANSATNPDIVGSAYPLPPLARTQRWSEIRAVDVLEHLPATVTDAALREWALCLEPGGTIYVQVPDGLTIARWLVDGDPLLLERIPPGWPQTLEGGASWRLFGGMDDGVYVQPGENPDFNLHRSLFSEASLRRSLELAGFVDVEIETNPHPNLLAWAVRA